MSMVLLFNIILQVHACLRSLIYAAVQEVENTDHV